ncbi:M50 family metallopeptidase [Psychrobacillus sp. NEAU-3TGS]|uniref:M50 family metallopeptidase n=1 Tax=Psychrobacillus sp. NEAU-3TGS TaxID=2995412 RepID=UPI002498E211|nr:M50 family metallopeptidase [Psychrobacillus sp. NEAU-3TGS]MDI2588792.1 M50 family metallopeptidase [Psychrobacillus sp. NEAU-3TGS]
MNSIFTPKWLSLCALLMILVGISFDRTYDMTVILSGIVLSLWIAITVHELGHVLAGKVSGFEFVFFISGPFQCLRTADGIRLMENKNWLYFGGVAWMTPPRLEFKKLAKKEAVFVAGGPTVSILIGILSLAVYYLSDFILFLYFAIMNIVIFFATAIPLKTSMKTDGYILLTLLKNNEDTTKLLDELILTKELLSSKQPTQWDVELVNSARQKRPSVENLQYAMLLYYYEVQQNGFHHAVKVLQSYKSIPITKDNKFPMSFIISMYQIELFLERDGNTQAILKQQKNLSVIEPVSYYRGQAMIAYLEKDFEHALANLEKVYTLVDKNESLYGFFIAEKILTNLVKEKIVRK